MRVISLPSGYNRSFDAVPGTPMALSPLVTRLLAANPGPFTFAGTGVYLVGGGDSLAVIDPGPLLVAHMDALQQAIGARRVSHILITHTHRDHCEAAGALKAMTGAKTYGFYDPLRPSHATLAHEVLGDQRATATSPSEALRAEGEAGAVQVEEADDREFVPDVHLRDGETITGDGFTLTALHTPGHASNHLCFALAEERALFTGDHVMGWSSSVIAPPDGDMGDYLASLKRLIARDDAILYPTHGGPVHEPAAYMTALLEHRLLREAQLQAALAQGITTIPALVASLYAGLDQKLRPAAAATIAAHLRKLERDGPG